MTDAALPGQTPRAAGVAPPREGWPLLRPQSAGPDARIARMPGGTPPQLVVIIDTEEEFDWAKPHARENTRVTAIAAQHRAQEIFARHGVVPTYVVDYPVVADDTAAGHLEGFRAAGACEIGAHLHPWVNPPDDEPVNGRNSFPGNLPAELERAKLARLTEAIAARFGTRPTVYKAGRYGVGPHTAESLEALGYTIDASIVPRTSFTIDGGPDFRAFGPEPYWFGRERRLLALPLSVGFAGHAARFGPALYPRLFGRLATTLHLPGLLARARMLERIRLTPEGVDGAGLRRLTRSLVRAGVRCFSLTYHSPSLAPGHTPYVRDDEALSAFLRTIDDYLRFFRAEVGGAPSSPGTILRLCAAPGD